MKVFRDNDPFNFFFYAGVVHLRSRFPDKVHHHYMQLVCGIRLLLESSAEIENQMAESCFDIFLPPSGTHFRNREV